MVRNRRRKGWGSSVRKELGRRLRRGRMLVDRLSNRNRSIVARRVGTSVKMCSGQLVMREGGGRQIRKILGRRVDDRGRRSTRATVDKSKKGRQDGKRYKVNYQ